VGDGARRDGIRVAARRGMGPLPRGDLGRTDGAVSRNERSKELGIYVGYNNVDGVDRGENVDGPVGPVAAGASAK
jgi:hypothetical protein